MIYPYAYVATPNLVPLEIPTIPKFDYFDYCWRVSKGNFGKKKRSLKSRSNRRKAQNKRKK